MKTKKKQIMLIDDNPDDNFFHSREIKKNNPDNVVITMNTGTKALDYLKSEENKNNQPDLIFLDINMPLMNGWEFLEEYNRLDKDTHQSTIIIMLTTSENGDDENRAKTYGIISDYKTKPLTEVIVSDIIRKYF